MCIRRARRARAAAGFPATSPSVGPAATPTAAHRALSPPSLAARARAAAVLWRRRLSVWPLGRVQAATVCLARRAVPFPVPGCQPANEGNTRPLPAPVAGVCSLPRPRRGLDVRPPLPSRRLLAHLGRQAFDAVLAGFRSSPSPLFPTLTLSPSVLR